MRERVELVNTDRGQIISWEDMTRETKVLFPYGISFSGDNSIPKLREYFEKNLQRDQLFELFFRLASLLHSYSR